MNTPFDPSKLNEIRSLAASGNKIMAIKLYREATGVSLREAKDAVEVLARGLGAAFPPMAAPAVSFGSDAMLEDRIRQLLAARQKIEAVKLYRERYRVGLKEAKDAVDAVEAQMRAGSLPGGMPPLDTRNIDPFAEQPGQGSRLAVVLVALLLLAAGVAFFIFFLRGG
ncbi:MAG: hypothetical protein AB1846_09860 [Chloroflexota bacterium]